MRSEKLSTEKKLWKKIFYQRSIFLKSKMMEPMRQDLL